MKKKQKQVILKTLRKVSDELMAGFTDEELKAAREEVRNQEWLVNWELATRRILELNAEGGLPKDVSTQVRWIKESEQGDAEVFLTYLKKGLAFVAELKQKELKRRKHEK
jgi:hypothetical protein